MSFRPEADLRPGFIYTGSYLFGRSRRPRFLMIVGAVRRSGMKSTGAGSREACVRDAKRFLESRGLAGIPINFRV
jgi:hypothetical protein